jgi:hypothetical protein
MIRLSEKFPFSFYNLYNIIINTPPGVSMQKAINLIIIIIILMVANHILKKNKIAVPNLNILKENVLKETTQSKYHCDGRIHCSQMTSCEEAKYFLENCPGVKMDGDHDGVPCEDQLCQ